MASPHSQADSPHARETASPSSPRGGAPATFTSSPQAALGHKSAASLAPVAEAPAAAGGGGATPAPAADDAAAARPATPYAAFVAHGGAAGLAEGAALLAAKPAGAGHHALLPPAPAASGGAASPHPVAPQTEESLREERKQGIADFKEAVNALCGHLTDIAEYSLLAKGSEEENARDRYAAALKQMTRLLIVCAKQHGAAY